MRTLANVAIAFGIAMILYGPDADMLELLRMTAPLWAVLQTVESIKRRAKARRHEEIDRQAAAERRRIQEILGL